ncbi:hypothetical protein [Lewinella sp. 4G2]|uniref:hypothetical protein n=1 Tax=Lewinella sp. 4G2 TaxID=1803372 RepID=UPI0007B49989|nr:hypothetical protein [Lewinella sp. 4G2]OAV43636.1 hypothetical protein A3850_003605 [Lewinella sp. 4G2]
MIKSIAISALLILLAIAPGGLVAQQSAPVVMYKSGSVLFTPDDGRSPYAVTSGDRLGVTGALQLKAGARVEINYQDKHLELKEAGEFQMDEVLQNRAESSGLLSRFYNFISNGLDQSKSRQSLEKAYLKNQGNAQGNTRGAGDGGLRNVRPFGGRLTAANYAFTWPAYPSASHYEFSILEESTGNFLITALAAENTFSVDLGQLNLADGQSYTWVCRAVTAGGDNRNSLLSRGAPKTELASITFSYSAAPFIEVFTATRGELPGAQGGMLHNLNLVMALEDHGFLADADALYAILLRETEDAALVNSLYASFLARWNLRDEAGSLLEGRR